MAIQIQAPDGSIAEFPEGTSDATITSVMAKAYPAPKPAGPAVSASQQRANADAQKRAATTPGLVRAVNNGFAFNAAGNLDALGAAAETGLHNAFAHATGQPDSGYGMKEAFSAVRGAEANASNAFAQQHPVQNIAANVLGAVVNPANRLAGGYVGQAKNVGQAVARSATTGAALGAAYGAGGSQPGQDVGQSAQQGAIAGAVTGAAAPVVARAAGSVVRGVGRSLGVSGNKAQPVVDALRQAKTAAYQSAEDLGAAYTPDAAKSLATVMQNDAQAANISPTLHPKASAKLAQISTQLTSGHPLSLGDLDQMRQ